MHKEEVVTLPRFISESTRGISIKLGIGIYIKCCLAEKTSFRVHKILYRDGGTCWDITDSAT
jgi:hypothetical protein